MTDVVTGSDLSFIPLVDLLDNTNYVWQVMAEDESGATYVTPMQSFVVNTENDLPSDFSLMSPDNGSMVVDLTPTMHWEVPTDADDQRNRSIVSYDVYVDTEETFDGATPVTVGENNYTPVNLSPLHP